MSRLPVPGADEHTWGSILNDFLDVAHNSDGSLKNNIIGIGQVEDGAITTPKLGSNNTPTTGQVLAYNGTTLNWTTPAGGAVPDADATTKGILRLAGDLGGTASSPTVPGLAAKAATLITAGTGLTGGGDLSANRTLAVVDDTSVQRVRVSKAGVLTGTHREVNFIDGSNVTVTTADDSANNRINVTIASTGGAGGAGGYGPNWVASSTAPAAVRTAVTNSGGSVADGTADNVEINAALATYKAVYLTEGTFNIAATITLPQATAIHGSGIGATQILSAAGVSGSLFSITSDHCTISRMTISGNGQTADGINANVTASTGFTTGQDACTMLFELVLRNIVGDGIIMQGFNNREGKLYNIHVWNATGRSYYLNCPDGSIQQCISGTPGGNGFELGTSASNWRITNCKSWYSNADGFLIQGVRHLLTGLEGQDNAFAGIRILGSLIALEGFTADSNSYEGTLYDNVHSGLEIGRTSAGTNSGGYNITVSGGQSWDKNEGSRGYKQRSGIRVRSGARDLTIVGVDTGDPAATHHNATAGIEFDAPADLNDSSNNILAISHDVRIASPAAAVAQTVWSSYKNTAAQEAVVTGTTLTEDAQIQVSIPGGGIRYSIEATIFYRADSTQDAKMAIVPSIVTGSGTIDGFGHYTYTDGSGVDQVDTKYLNTGATGPIIADGASVDAANSVVNSEVRSVRVSCSVYVATTITTGKFALKVSESAGTGTGVKVLAGSRIKAELLAIA